MMPAKKVGLGFQNPEKYADEKYPSLFCTRKELIQALKEESKLSIANLILEMREERRDGKKSGMMPIKPISGG